MSIPITMVKKYLVRQPFKLSMGIVLNLVVELFTKFSMKLRQRKG